MPSCDMVKVIRPVAKLARSKYVILGGSDLLQKELGIICWKSRQKRNPDGASLVEIQRGNLFGLGEIIPRERMWILSPQVPTVQHIITLSGNQIWC